MKGGLQLGLQLSMQLECNWYATGMQLGCPRTPLVRPTPTTLTVSATAPDRISHCRCELILSRCEVWRGGLRDCV